MYQTKVQRYIKLNLKVKCVVAQLANRRLGFGGGSALSFAPDQSGMALHGVEYGGPQFTVIDNSIPSNIF